MAMKWPTVKFNTASALVSIFTSKGSVLLGVKPDEEFVAQVWKDTDPVTGEELYHEGRWLWGVGWERYDWCVKYTGFGPLLLLCK